MSATNSLLSANLRSHGRRYISTGLAVAISTAFIVITLIVMTAMTSGLTSSVYSQYRGGTIVVSQNDDAPEGAIENAEKTLSATSGVTAIKHMAQWPADAQTETTRAGLYVSPMAPKPFAGLDLSAGTAPTADDEIVIPEHTALTLSLKVGDTVRVRAGFSAGDRTLTVVGTTHTNTISMGVPASYVTDGGFSAIFGTTASGKFIVATSAADTDSNANPPSATQDEWVATANSALSGISGVSVTSVHQAIQDDLNQARLGASMTMGIMLIFPAIAALVASIVVSSTFRVVLTQRTRELALLRTLGATRRQVRSLVTREALAIGAISSAIGVAAGWLIGALAEAGTGLASSVVAALAGASVWQLALTWLGATLFTTLVGVFPARAASRVAPVAALAPVNEAGAGARKKHTVRFVIGALIAVAGCGAVALAWRSSGGTKFLGAFAGSLLALLGALLVASVLLPALTRAFGSAFPGTLSAMARENTMRNPGRTSATGTAIIIGVTLVVTIIVGAASVRTTLTNAVNDARPFDLMAVSTDGALTDDQQAAIAATDGVAATVAQYAAPGTLTTTSGAPAYAPGEGTDAEDEAQASSVMITGEPDYTGVTHSTVKQMGDGQVRVGDEALAGQTLRLCAESCVDLSATYDKNGSVGEAQVSEKTLRSIATSLERQAIIIKLADGADAETVQAALLKDSHLSVNGSALERQTYTKIIDRLMLVLVGLLGVSVLVSLVGVANTLSLSVAERTRENGLLRALGLTRRQMKSLLALEALFLSLTGALIGVGMGVAFGWVGVMSLPVEGATPVLSVPWLQLAGVCVVAVVSALVASWLPGRRAAKVSPSEALATE
ncbi:FtsX-like permease family protein [Actinomyces bouchesdurhonensis]|uniref:FtsX-like permease family protein n=1 Tax=Actinomyces bouchesdurhonensis TaxID=1852361 RepID=UPI0028F12B04|nr:FtsX-like permease family protein [Actinomyces bouchesdurhonensis]